MKNKGGVFGEHGVYKYVTTFFTFLFVCESVAVLYSRLFQLKAGKILMGYWNRAVVVHGQK